VIHYKPHHITLNTYQVQLNTKLGAMSYNMGKSNMFRVRANVMMFGMKDQMDQISGRLNRRDTRRVVLAYILSYVFRRVERGLKLQNLLSPWLKLLSSTEIGMLSTENYKFNIILNCEEASSSVQTHESHSVHSRLVLQLFSLYI